MLAGEPCPLATRTAVAASATVLFAAEAMRVVVHGLDLGREHDVPKVIGANSALRGKDWGDSVAHMYNVTRV